VAFNTEISTSDNYDVFLLFRLQSLCNLGTKNSSGLTPPAYDWLVTAPELPLSESESESYITTDSQSASLSWNKAPIWGVRPHIYLSLTITALFLWMSSQTRGRVWLLYMLLALASIVFLGSEFLWTRNHILLSQMWDFPFRRLLRLAGSRWRYSTPPPHRVTSVWVWVLRYDRQSVGQSVLE
jgi:hypothetical protein